MNNEQWIMNNEQWTMNNEQWTMNNEQWTMNNEQWTMNRWQWTIENEERMKINKQLRMNNYHPIYFRLNLKLTITNEWW